MKRYELDQTTIIPDTSLTRQGRPLSETQHQIAVMKWTQQPEIRQKWPELKLLYHIPNERSCTERQGAILKKAGLKRGIPDLHLPVARGQYNSLYIEMKRPGEKETTDQRWWIEQLNAHGNFAEVCHGYESAIRVIEWYMGLPRKVMS